MKTLGVQVLHALDEPVECVTYNRWLCHLPEGLFTCVADADAYRAELGRLGGVGAEADWKKLEDEMEPLAEVPPESEIFDVRASFSSYNHHNRCHQCNTSVIINGSQGW